MTEDRARFVRDLRVTQGYSYRALAQACADAWGTDWNSNQGDGTVLCFAAARVLGERYPTDWNDGS